VAEARGGRRVVGRQAWALAVGATLGGLIFAVSLLNAQRLDRRVNELHAACEHESRGEHLRKDVPPYALLIFLAVPVSHRNVTVRCGDPVPQRLHVVDLFLDREFVKSGEWEWQPTWTHPYHR
jgi:hypothetical protein